MRGFARFAAKRATLIVIALLGVALLAGGSWALTGEGSETPEVVESETPAVEETPAAPDESDVSGEAKERYHGEDCTLATGLEGNWTHGDYVGAVAQDDDDATAVPDAAKSRCGKPLNAGKDGEKKNETPERPERPEPASKGGRSADHRQNGGGS